MDGVESLCFSETRIQRAEDELLDSCVTGIILALITWPRVLAHDTCLDSKHWLTTHMYPNLNYYWTIVCDAGPKINLVCCVVRLLEQVYCRPYRITRLITPGYCLPSRSVQSSGRLYKSSFGIARHSYRNWLAGSTKNPSTPVQCSQSGSNRSVDNIKLSSLGYVSPHWLTYTAKYDIESTSATSPFILLYWNTNHRATVHQKQST